MDKYVVAKRYQRLADVYLVLIFAITVVNGFAIKRIATSWSLGDWLVNYEGGFVRRGLWGELALLAGRTVHISPVSLTLILAILVYGVIFLLVRMFVTSSSWNWWVLALVISPCTLAFSAIDKYAGYHKEILYFAALGLLLWMLRRGERRGWVLMVYLSAVSVFTILSHEPQASYAPYYVAALAIGLRSLQRAATIATVPAILAIICLYAVVTHPGNAAIVPRICASLGPENTGMCDGWIGHYMASSTKKAQEEVVRFVAMFHYNRRYPVLALVALAPIAGGFVVLWRQKKLRFDLKVLAATACISLAASVPLFLYGIDWGRWIYIHIFSLFLLLLFLDSRETKGSATVESVPDSRAKRLTMYGLLLIYATCWNMPYCGGRHDGLAGRLIEIVNHHVAAHRGR